MKKKRLIPVLLLRNGWLVQSKGFSRYQNLGNPVAAVTRLSEWASDEIIYLDIVASLYQRNLDFGLLRNVTENIFIPVTVGGGIRSIQDINNALRAGADKVAINTHAIKNPEFLKQAVLEFGSQCIVAYIEAKRQPNGLYEAYTDGGREHSGLDAIQWAKKVLELGAGEILISSIDQDGTRLGYDIGLIRQINNFAKVSMIAHGGVGKLEDILDAILSGVDAISAASVFHYGDCAISQIKSFLSKKDIQVRII